MLHKDRKLEDSRVNNSVLLRGLTRLQRINIELLLNARKGKCILYDYKTGCFYKENVIPATLNDLGKAIGKKVDKLVRVLGGKGVLRQVVDIRGRLVWMVNPDLYWDYVSYELYYNRWLWSVRDHFGASQVVDSSLYHGYFYHSVTGLPIKKITNYHWFNMFKWWKLYIGDDSPDLIKEALQKQR